VVPRRVPHALPVRHQDGEVCDDKVIVVMMMMIMVMVLMMMVTMVVVVVTTIIMMVVITMITMTMMMMDRYVDKQQMRLYHDSIIVSCVSYSENTFSHRLISFLDGLSCLVDYDAS